MKLKSLLFVGALLLSVPAILTSCNEDDTEIDGTRLLTKEIVKQQEALAQAMEADASLSEFAAAFRKLDLAATGADRLTVFAVKNDGLTLRASETLATEELLKRHIMICAYDEEMIAKFPEIQTLSGDKYGVSVGGKLELMINGLPVGKATRAENSFLYVIDRNLPAEDNRTPFEKEMDAMLAAMSSHLYGSFYTDFAKLAADDLTDPITVVVVADDGWNWKASEESEQIGNPAMLQRHIFKGTYTPDKLKELKTLTANDGVVFDVSTDEKGNVCLNNRALGPASIVGENVLYMQTDVLPLILFDPAADYSAASCSVISMSPYVMGLRNAAFEWVVEPDGSVDTEYAVALGDGSNVAFIARDRGEYTVTINAVTEETDSEGNKVKKTLHSESIKLNITTDASAYKPKAEQLIAYNPAPGANIFHAAAADAAFDKLHLGAFGGSATVKFDHTLINIPGRCDFRTWRGESGVCPCVIHVAYDSNKNGIADEDEWYEIKGSATAADETITYFKPAQNPCKPAEGAAENEGLKYELSDKSVGYLFNTVTGIWYPEWQQKDTYSLQARQIKTWPKNKPEGDDKSEDCKEDGWGYANVYAGDDPRAAIDIDWAVDKSGKAVVLPGIDFIRVENAFLGNNPTKGEYRADVVNGIDDLHLTEGGLTVTPDKAQGKE